MKKKINIPSHGSSDHDLVDLIRQGNQRAFDQLYMRYHKLCYSVALRYTQSRDVAQDVVQAVFIKLWEQRAELTITANMRNFLFTMVKNHILNKLRDETNAMAHNYKVVQQRGEYEEDLNQLLDDQEKKEIIHQAISELPDQKRVICELRIRDELSNQEIADNLGVAVATVKSHYTTAQRMLRGVLLKKLKE